jgi:ribonuclease P protein component
VRKRSQFRQIQASGERVITAGFIFLMQCSSHGHGPRLGITASRRVGNSVFRNRAKRLVREAFRHLRSTWPQDVDVVVIVRRSLADSSLAAVVAEWQSAAPRLHRKRERLAEPPSPAPEGTRPQHSSTGGAPTCGNSC